MGEDKNKQEQVSNKDLLEMYAKAKEFIEFLDKEIQNIKEE